MTARPAEAIEIHRARRRDWPALRRLFPDDFSEQALDRRLAVGFSSIGLSVRRQNQIATGLYRSSGYAEDERSQRALILTKELDAPAPPSPTQLPSPSRPMRALDRLLYAVVKPFWT